MATQGRALEVRTGFLLPPSPLLLLQHSLGAQEALAGG